MTVDRRWRILLRVIGLGYLAALLLIPIGVGRLCNGRSAPIHRWVCGALCLTLGPFGALAGAFVLAGLACAFY